MRSNYKYLVIVALASALFACNSDSGSDPIIDITRPVIKSVSPADVQTDVPTTSVLNVNFSESMTCSSLTTAGTFSLVNNTTANSPVSGAVSCRNIDTTARFTSDIPLPRNNAYTATVTTAAEDKAGNNLKTDYSWSFTSADQIAVTISWTANRESAVNTNGGGYKVYYSDTPGFALTDAGVILVNVPYISGTEAPTSTIVNLDSGTTYYIRVIAYSALNAPGQTGGSSSQPSADISIAVP